jgi:hypothetical protein
LRCAFHDGDSCAVRHHHGSLQQSAYQVEDPSVAHPLAHAIQQALMMNPVERER